jgi:hypothetical protein
MWSVHLDSYDRDFVTRTLFRFNKSRLFRMMHNKVAGPCGQPTEFYQHFWHFISNDILF